MTKEKLSATDFAQVNSDFREMGFGTFDLAATPVVFNELLTQYVASEWREKDGDVELHIYHMRRHPTLQWNLVNYAQRLYDALMEEFRLQGFQDRLLVEFVPEANAWYVQLRGIAAVMTPDEQRFVRAINQAGPGGLTNAI